MPLASVSLVITTRSNGIVSLKRLLDSLERQRDSLERQRDSLERQTDQPLEVVVVTQECATLAAPVLEGRRNLSIKHAPCALCGISQARNIGLSQATGRIVGFPDDDCWYPEDTIRRVVEHFREHPNDAFVCTSVFDPVRRQPFGHRRTAKSGVAITVANAFILPISVGLFLNMPRAGETIRFDEQLGAGAKWGSGEETDLILSLLRSGHRGLFVPGITVYHEINYDQPSLFPLTKTLSYSSGFGAVIAKSVARRKQYAAGIAYMDLLARALARLALSCLTLRKGNLSVQLAKTRGMLSGLLEGARYYAQ